MILPRRRALLALLCGATLTVAGCATSTNGSGQPAGSGASTPRPVTTPTDAAGLAAVMRDGIASVTSAHLALTVSSGGETITGQGDEQLASGKLTAMDLTETIPQAGDVRLLIVDATTYAQLPAKFNTSGKPWLLVTTNSTNVVIKTIATSLDSIQTSASLDQFTAFTSAAQSLTVKGTEQVDGVATTHYSLSVDVLKLPATLPGRDVMIQAGLTTLPIELWIDDSGRPVKLSESFTVQGQSVSSLITMSRFDAPVTITAPPADQVATS